jgi:hypothetical protein
LHAAIRMVNDTVDIITAPPQGHFQGIKSQIGG